MLACLSMYNNPPSTLPRNQSPISFLSRPVRRPTDQHRQRSLRFLPCSVLQPGNRNLQGSIPSNTSFSVLRYQGGSTYLKCSQLPCTGMASFYSRNTSLAKDWHGLGVQSSCIIFTPHESDETGLRKMSRCCNFCSKYIGLLYNYYLLAYHNRLLISHWPPSAHKTTQNMTDAG